MDNESKHILDLFSLIKELKGAGINFIVCGGIACILHGVERTTYDIDISVDLEVDNLKKIIEVCKRFNLIPRIPEPVENLLIPEIREKWVEEKGALVFTFVSKNNPLQLDIFLKYPKSYKELLANSEVIILDNFKILVSSISDLIYAKESINEPRDKDLIDIKELKKILNDK